MSQHKKNISVKCKILLKNICMIHSYLFLIRYLKFMLKRRTASAGFFSQSGTINSSSLVGKEVKLHLNYCKIINIFK
ncbi:hypothetical protein [Candidatus Tisiphia endosymbiont of Parasteatoda lunata]|uniref:hypothetical protein n=1 Tax=Candidatus Tisiphia endosymbiont of Parasteatoda lunata TaxID=3066275 RepID=UPI00313DB134